MKHTPLLQESTNVLKDVASLNRKIKPGNHYGTLKKPVTQSPVQPTKKEPSSASKYNAKKVN